MALVLFSTPLSASSVGGLSSDSAEHPASSKMARVLVGSNFSDTRAPENSSRVIVDHGVDVCVADIDQPDDTRVDMPDFVGRRGTNAESGLGGMNSFPRTAPTMSPNESMPRRRRCEDLPETLGKKRQCARWDMPVVIVGNHIFHDDALVGSELLWVNVGTGR